MLWSALSLIVLLAGIAAVLLAFGKFDYLGWMRRGHHIHPQLLPGESSAGQRALVKLFVVVAVLFLLQTLVGGRHRPLSRRPEELLRFPAGRGLS